MILTIEVKLEDDGRWIAEVVEIPGALAYGETLAQAKAKAQASALRALADRLEHGETTTDPTNISFKRRDRAANVGENRQTDRASS